MEQIWGAAAHRRQPKGNQKATKRQPKSNQQATQKEPPRPARGSQPEATELTEIMLWSEDPAVPLQRLGVHRVSGRIPPTSLSKGTPDPRGSGGSASRSAKARFSLEDPGCLWKGAPDLRATATLSQGKFGILLWPEDPACLWKKALWLEDPALRRWIRSKKP